MRAPLDGQHFEVLVIGGGINGVAIARECASAGRRTLLVEQTDFGAGTTSRSTRLIHGGLRYLEQGEIAQVRESLQERQKLLRQYPHLVRRIHFLLALDGNSRRSALAVRAGLWLYRGLAAGGRVFDLRQEQDRLERLLDSGRRFSIFNFEDAQCEFPERLVADWLMEAKSAGCEVRNHTRVLAVKVTNGKATGAVLRDELSRKEECVESRWIVNATGPWLDEVCDVSGVRTGDRMIGGIRGSHIVIREFSDLPRAAVYTEGIDGRPIFVVPWNGQVLVGTTEIADDGDPARVQASNDEIRYLLSSLRRLFPQLKILNADICYAFAGVRPLPRSRGNHASAITRRHFFHDHTADGAAGLISLVGGKLTTAACAARECAAKIGIKSAGMPVVVTAPGSVVEAEVDRATKEIVDTAGIDRKSASAIFEWHGPRSLEIARIAHSERKLREQLCSHTEHIIAEAVDAFQSQYAMTLGDVLLRRVPIALDACWSAECGHAAGARIAFAMGWSEARAGAELERFELEREAFLQKPETGLEAAELPTLR
ncbi:MAG TPA: glycerol-3-phosphate dehydrogenase/oxidase [Terriglobales bacterium]|nr:glycerol-3-phosphate dehydrogenase/oxidase [Terriglobales bacterium]